MPNKKYERGRAFEYRVAKKLRDLGFFVTRSAGSHGAADLVALGRSPREFKPPWMVQCKGGQADMTRAQRNEFVRLAYDHNARPVLVTRGMKFYRLGIDGYEEEFTPTAQEE